MDAFPAFFPLAGARVVIAGAGEPAAQRTRLLDGSPAEVVHLEGDAALRAEAYAGATLVFVASTDGAFAREAAAAAADCSAPVNVFDRPDLSDFSVPALIDRGAVVAAVSTGGAAPLLAGLLRAELEVRIPADAGRKAQLLGSRRDAIRAAYPNLADRRAFLRPLLEAVEFDAAMLDVALAKAAGRPAGRVDLIERPEADDLLSLRAARALAAAEIVVADPSARDLVERHARRDAERWEIDTPAADLAARLAARARSGDRIAVVGASRALADALAQTGADLDVLRAAAP